MTAPTAPGTNATFSAADLAMRTVQRRAVEAAVWGIPIVNHDLMFQAGARVGATMNQIVYWSKLLDWKNQTLTPNPNSIYLMPCFDTAAAGPIVVEIPPAEGGSITGTLMDCWQTAFEDVGPAGVDKGAGGKYLILPPGYDQPGYKIGPPIYPKWFFYYNCSHLRIMPQPSFIIDITGYEQRKYAATSAYRSQFGPWDATRVAPASSRREDPAPPNPSVDHPLPHSGRGGPQADPAKAGEERVVERASRRAELAARPFHPRLVAALGRRSPFPTCGKGRASLQRLGVERDQFLPVPLGGFRIMFPSSSSPRAARIGREQIEKRYQKMLAQALPGKLAAERAALVLSLVAGVQVMRQMIGLAALAHADPAALAGILAPVLQRLIAGE